MSSRPVRGAEGKFTGKGKESTGGKKCRALTRRGYRRQNVDRGRLVMPVDYYPNKSIEELLGILSTLQKRQTEGTLTEVSAVGIRMVKTVAPGTSALDIEILRVLYSLYKRALTTPEEANFPNPYLSRVRRTRSNYV